MHGDSKSSRADPAHGSEQAPSARRASARALNQVDFWRGYALIAIFINHIPGIWYEQFTHRAFGWSDSAELFVFLAGFSLRYLSESRSEKLHGLRLFMRLEARAFTLYAAQIFIVAIALAMMAQAALTLDAPLILQWNNAAAFFESPIPTQIGIALLSHQMGYFDVLPLYIVLMVAAPLVVFLGRLSLTLLLVVSGGVWAATLYSETNIPTWPVEGVWFFNPLAWQFQFVLGFVLARPRALEPVIVAHRGKIRLLGAIVAAVGLYFAMISWNPNPFDVPEPRLFFINDKTFLSPLRLVHMLGLVALFGGLFDWLARFSAFRFLSEPFCLLGRNSLHVFCAGSLLSLAGQIARYAAPAGLVTDTIVLFIGVAALLAVAWGNEWRIRLPR